MDYFDQLKLESINLLNNLQLDATYLRDSIQGNNHHKDSINVICRLLSIQIERITECTSKTYENWQKLTRVHQNIRAIEGSITFISFRLRKYLDRPDGYHLIDKLCTEILQKSGLQNNIFRHFVVCGGNTYQRTHPMNIIHCRLTDFYRIFHLGLLAHEFGHHFVHYFFTPVPLINNNPFDADHKPDPEKVFDNWKIEVVSDIFGSLIMGPTLLASHAYMPDYWLFQPEAGSEFLNKFRIHPPCEIRFNYHKEVLDAMNVPYDRQIPDLFEMSNDVIITGNLINGEDYDDRIGDITEFIEVFRPEFDSLHTILKRNVTNFTEEDWEMSLEFSNLFQERDFSNIHQFTAIQMINGVNLAKNQLGSHEDETLHLTELINNFNSLL